MGCMKSVDTNLLRPLLHFILRLFFRIQMNLKRSPGQLKIPGFPPKLQSN